MHFEQEISGIGPKEPGPEEIAWVRGLLRTLRNVSLLTEMSPDKEGRVRAHSTPLYSAFTRLLTGNLQAVWRSRENSDHSTHILRDCRRAAAIGERAVAEVGFQLCDTSSWYASLDMRGWARKIENPTEARIALAIINGKRRRRTNEPPLELVPENRYAQPYTMWVADIYQASIPTDIVLTSAEGVFPVDYGDAEIELDRLRNFELDLE